MPGFWRTCRTAFRWCRFTLWTVLVLAILTFAWLDLVGLPDFLKTRIISTLQDRGLSLQFVRMRFRPVHGLVADQVQVGGMVDTNRAVFTAAEIQLHLDYPALLHRQILVDGVVVRNGKFVLPVSPTNSLTWQNIESTVRFLPEQTWAIDDLRSDFANCRLQLAIQLAHASAVTNWAIFAAKKAAGPGTPSTLANPLKDFADQMQRIQFTGQPQFSLLVNGDARDIYSFRLQVNARVPAVKTDWGSAKDLQFAARITSPSNTPAIIDPALSFWTNAYPFRLAWIARAADIDTPQIGIDKILCSGSWAAPELKVTRLGGHLGNGSLEAAAGLDVDSRRLTFTNDSSFDPHLLAFLLTPSVRHQLSEILWTGPPSLKIGGSTFLPAWTNTETDWQNVILTNLSLAGTAGFSNAVVRATPLDLARVHFDYGRQMITLSDAELDQGATKLALNGQHNLATKDFTFHLVGTLDIASARPFLIGTPATNALKLIELNDPLALDVAGAGNLDHLLDATAWGHLALTNFAVRGQTFGSLATDFNCSNRIIRVLNPQGYRAAGSQYLTADSVTLDFNQMMMFFTNGFSTFDQMVIPRAIGPKTAGPIEPYQYVSAPTARVHGQLPIRDFKNGRDLEGTDITFDIIQGAPFRWQRLYATNITGTVRWMGQYLVLSNLNAQCYNGQAAGHAYFDFTPVGYGCDFDFDVTATSLNVNLLARDLSQKETNRLEGFLTGHVAVTDANSKTWQSWDGYGSAELRDGLLWNIPLFGFVSPMLNAVAPGLGNSRATDATMSFIMTNGVARSDPLVIDTPTMRLQYSGTVDLQQNVNARVTAQLLRNTWGVGALFSTVLWPISKLFECRVTGVISAPKVTPVLLAPFRYTGGTCHVNVLAGQFYRPEKPMSASGDQSSPPPESKPTAALSDPERWVDEYGDYLFKFAFSRLRDATRAEDAVQETFLAALKGGKNFAGRSAEKSWLVGILKNKIYDYFRKASRETVFTDLEFYADEESDRFVADGIGQGGWIHDRAPLDWPNPGANLDNELFWKAYRDCAAKLPKNVATVFNLREVDDLESKEICELLKISESNLWVMLHRARMALRRCLETNWFTKTQ